MAKAGGIGASIARHEDTRHLFGEGEFVADIRLPGTRDVAFVRSPLAHARVHGVTKPRGREGEVFAAADLGDVAPIHAPSALPGFKRSRQPVFAADRVRHVGEIVAACVADDRAAAEDLAEAVTLDLEELPAVYDSRQARDPVAPLLHDEWGDNVFLESVTGAKLGSLRDEAAVSVTRTFRTARQCMSPLEGRAVLAYRDRRQDMLVVYTASQMPHIVRSGLAECLGLTQGRIRVISPDVGGGFGYKGILLAEEVFLGWLAMRCGHPVRWIEDRREQLTGNANCREHHYVITGHAAADGRLLGIECEELGERVRHLGAHLLQVVPERVKLRDGAAWGPGGGRVSLADVGRLWYRQPENLPDDVDPRGVEVTQGYRAVRDSGTFSYACHACVVEVDVETGGIEILDYVVVEDGGVLVNPMIVDGQVLGGTAQGIGTALYEEMPFDEAGQPLASTLADYRLPGAAEVPAVRIEHMETPSPYSRFGQKGIGEGGAIGPPAAIANAINQALAPLGVEVDETPRAHRAHLGDTPGEEIGEQPDDDAQDVMDETHPACDPAHRPRELDRIAAQRIGRGGQAWGLLGVGHHRFEGVELTRKPGCEAVRQQAEGGVALGAVPASDVRPARGLARVGAVACERTAPVGVIRTLPEACIAPRLRPNVSLAGKPRLVAKLHRPWPGGGPPARANSSLV